MENNNNFNFEEEAMDINSLLNPITKNCSECGSEFTLIPAEQKFYISNGYHLPNKCLSCRRSDREVYTFICTDCNNEFTMKGSEIKYFKRNNMELPKRCKRCIQYKKEKNNRKV